VDRRGREPNVVVNRLLTLDQADKEFTSQVAIRFETGIHTVDDMQRVRGLLQRYPGATDVVLLVDSGTDALKDQQGAPIRGNRLRFVLTTGNECRVSVGPEFLQGLTEILGDAHFELKAQKSRRPSGQGIGR